MGWGDSCCHQRGMWLTPPLRRLVSRTPNRSPAREVGVQRAASLSTRPAHTYAPTTGRSQPSSPRPNTAFGAGGNAPIQPSALSSMHPPVEDDERVPAHASSSASASGAGAGRMAGSASGVASAPRSASRNRGKQVGDWILGKTLGAGSMGKVKLATHQYSREKVGLISSMPNPRS